jgi:preprotein translocase subunit YajC
VFAQEATGSSSLTTFIFLGLMIAVFYFFIIRPQRQRQKAQQELSESLEIGDEIRTIGGIHGRILRIEEESVLLEVEQGQIRVARRAVGAKAGESQEA